MVSPLDAAYVVVKPLKKLIWDRMVGYLKYINSYEENMRNLVKELGVLSAKKLDLAAKVKRDEANQRVMTRETGNWLRSLMDLIEMPEMRQLMKEERVAEIVVKMMERRVLKKLWKEDREIFDIVVDVVKRNSHPQRVVDAEVVDAEEGADYKKIAKIAIDVMNDIAHEFTQFIKSRDDAAVTLVKLLNNVDLQNVDLEKLRKDGDEMAMVLSKAEGIIRKEVGHNHDDDDDVVQPVNESSIKEEVKRLRKRMGSLTAFLDDENFKKDLPDAAKLALEVMTTLSNSSGSDQAVENNKPHRCCGYCIVRCQVYRRHHDMSERAVTMIEAIKSAIDRCPPDPVTRPVRDDELENIPGEFMNGLESREVLLQRILIALKKDQVKIVGVYGMGGSGKTTLVKEIAHRRTSDLFDKTVVVEVSETPSIKGIQNQIAGRIDLILDDMNTVAQRAQKLFNRLKSEKILIVLDNIWTKLKLDEVGIPRESSKDFCCKLLITAREERVCMLMDVQEPNLFKVGLLNEREALNLFENQTAKKVGVGEFKPVSNRLLKKCGGLPLAIAATASALRGKDLPMWSHFAETSEKPISCQVSSEYRETYSVLETSYKFIDIEEKRIFLYLACLSPLDSAVTVDDLMRYGIGLNLFQHINKLSEAMDQATTWATELISSSLLIKGDSNGELKIHDLVRASYISFSDKGKDRKTLVESIPRWMCEETFEKITSISLMSGHGHDFSRLSGVKAPVLEILLMKGDVSSTTLPCSFFDGMDNLKVLSLSNMNFNLGLPESMGQLNRLKTLYLQNCKLKDVKLIGKLVNLLVLSLHGSILEELAVEIGELYKLRLLDIEECKGMKRIPGNTLSRLSNLEGLYMLNGFDDWASTNNQVNDGGEYNQASGSELNMLSHLNVLEMDVSKTEQLLTVNNGQLIEQLEKFKICGRRFFKSNQEYSCVLQLVDIDPSPNSGLRAFLKKTECLTLSECNRLTKNVLPELDENGLKDLKYFRLVISEVKSIISSSEENESMTFANLEILELQEMPNLEMICDGKAPVRIFSNLRSLYLYELPNLKSGLSLTSALLNLNEVYIVYCPLLKFVANKEDATNETEVEMFPCLKSLYLRQVDHLSCMLGQSGNEMSGLFNAESKYQSLESLELVENRIIVMLWSPACYVSGFQNLKTLHIQNCHKLQSLGSPYIFAALVKLEELKIINCDRLQDVISQETDGGIILNKVLNFPKLKHLSVEDSSAIKRFYGGSYNLKFPNLKSLCLSAMEDFINFDGIENSTTLFSDKIEFPRLEELDVKSVSNKVLRLWNWSSSLTQGETESGSISLNPLPNLLILRLGQVNGLVSFPDSVSHKLTHLEVNKFNNIKSLFSVSIVSGEAFYTYSQLPYLKTLSVCECESLEQLFDSEDEDVAMLLCERLIEIKLTSMQKLKILPLYLLKSIHSLSLYNLSWKYVFSADLFIKGKEQLQQLESLEIEKCDYLEVIIEDDLVSDKEESVYSFPRLKTLKLVSLDISKFASKPNTEIQFPSLESIELSQCHKMKSFWSGSFIAPKLKWVYLEECDGIECFLSEKRNEIQEMPFLERVLIIRCGNLLSFNSQHLVAPKLQNVVLSGCSKMKWFSRGDPNNNDILELPSLEVVSIYGCNDMKSFSSGGVDAPKLNELATGTYDYSKCSNEELQNMLDNLLNYYCGKEEDEEEEEEEEDQSDGKKEELQNDGPQDKQKTDGDDEVEELPTVKQGNDKSQQEQSME